MPIGPKLEKLLGEIESECSTVWLRNSVAEVRAELAEEKAGERVVEVQQPVGGVVVHQRVWAGQNEVRFLAQDLAAIGLGAMGFYTIRRRPDPEPKVRPYSIRLPAGDRAVLCPCGRAHVDGASQCGMCGRVFEGEPRDLPE